MTPIHIRPSKGPAHGRHVGMQNFTFVRCAVSDANSSYSTLNYYIDTFHVCACKWFTFHFHTIILQLCGFCPDNLVKLVPEETFTHSHLSWSSVIPYLLPPSITIYGILPVQFTCLIVFFHNLYPLSSNTSLTCAASLSNVLCRPKRCTIISILHSSLCNTVK